jgi:hypothetical protein
MLGLRQNTPKHYAWVETLIFTIKLLGGNCRFPQQFWQLTRLNGLTNLLLFTILKGIGNSIINSIQFIKSILLLLIVPICWPAKSTYLLSHLPQFHMLAPCIHLHFIYFPCFFISPNALQNSVQTTFINSALRYFAHIHHFMIYIIYIILNIDSMLLSFPA